LVSFPYVEEDFKSLSFNIPKTYTINKIGTQKTFKTTLLWLTFMFFVSFVVQNKFYKKTLVYLAVS